MFHQILTIGLSCIGVLIVLLFYFLYRLAEANEQETFWSNLDD